MTADSAELIAFDHDDADAVWAAWVGGADDILAYAAFERTLRHSLDLEDDALYFRPGGWVVNLPATAARTAIAAALLAASFQVAGLDDVETEIIITAASFVAAMDLRRVRLGRKEQRLLDGLRRVGLDGKPVTAKQAHHALPKKRRREVTRDEVADALDQLVAAGAADRDGERWVVRAQGDEAWIRIGLDLPG